jgi:CDP-diacylglycerol--glycerol-3-phosphate 3-phosphatidyltransferase
MKYVANSITCCRMLLAVGLLFTTPFSATFWICYLCAGLSDILDGLAAKVLKQESELGAKLDSAADILLVCAAAVIVLRPVAIPLWLWICAAAIGILRLTGYAVGYVKFHTFSALHTYLNKAAGLTLFGFPLICFLLGLQGGGILICAVCAISAIEELAITISSKSLNRNCRSVADIFNLHDFDR